MYRMRFSENPFNKDGEPNIKLGGMRNPSIVVIAKNKKEAFEKMRKDLEVTDETIQVLELIEAIELQDGKT